MSHKSIGVTFLLLLTSFLYGQKPTIQDCLGAIPICQLVYVETQSPSGVGNYANEVNPAIHCTDQESNSIWYTFTTSINGQFGFILTPNNSNDDYDWALFDLTNAKCEDIRNNASLQVSCNAAGGNPCHGPTGTDGSTPYDVQGAGCGNFPPNINQGFTAMNALINVQKGNTYVLMVSNWTGSTFGYTIDFSSSTAGIIDVQKPEVVSLEIPQDCGDDDFKVVFSENVKCNSIDASNFSLTGPGGPYVMSISSDNCDRGGNYASEFTINVSPPLTLSGDYIFRMLANSMREIVDACENTSDLDSSFMFRTDFPGPPIANLGNDTLICDSTFQKIINVANDDATYLWQDGKTDSTYLISGPGTYAVTISNACGRLIDSLVIDYIEPPYVDLGPDTFLCPGAVISLDVFSNGADYVWNTGSDKSMIIVSDEGTYSVVKSNACGNDSDSIFIESIPALDVDLQNMTVGCVGDVITLDVKNDKAEYMWSDGSEDSIRNIISGGNYMVTVSTKCETVIEEVDIEFVEANLNLGNDTVICDDVQFELNASNPFATYMWHDGSMDSINTVTGPGDYIVTVTTPCGELTDMINVSIIPSIDLDLGPDDYLCDGSVVLDATSHPQATYLWHDGSGRSTYTVREGGTYYVEISSDCETVSDTIIFYDCESCPVYVPNIFSPNGDNINDEFMVFTDCDLTNFQLNIFNRWGSQVFASIDQNSSWNGIFNDKLAQAGVYAYTLSYNVFENGKELNVSTAGSVTVFR